ncbi:MAG: glycoside hydrolase family protein [Chitinophagaceae bacterium]|nr:glycoside hydrolase family protein [Chitinophagaceae bacterium]
MSIRICTLIKWPTLFALYFFSKATAQSAIQQYQNLNFSKVKITDQFWKPKMEKVSTVTLPVCIDQTAVKTPRIRNFEIAAGKAKGNFKGIFYDDSDVFKALEAMAYSIKNHPDHAIETTADEWIDLIAAAQLPDGYINTYYSLQFPEKRWTDMSMHEDYNGGHLIEAAVAYFDATGKRKLLDVAIKFANHFSSLFGPGKRDWVTGHQELELALVKLYKTTGNENYLHLANWLLDERGKKLARGYTWTEWKDTGYAQDLKPLKEQTEITGHAVRAMYMYTGAADVAALTGDSGYLKAMQNVWEDVVYRNMYLTGGIGSAGSNEGFTTDYDLPNENAYCETCASVGMVFWNQRMGMLTGESKYIDVLERSLYNGALDGISLEGNKFFYGNPLASVGKNARRDWFGTACCPANIARLIESLGNYLYGYNNENIWINLFVGSTAIIPVNNQEMPMNINTNYPWDGSVRITFSPQSKADFALHIRIPGWAGKDVVPGGLYLFKDVPAVNFVLTVNRKKMPYKLEKGYAVIKREWKKNDVVEIDLPMEIKRIISRPELKANEERVALQRGPLVYCVEGSDNDGEAWNLILPANAILSAGEKKIINEKVITIKAMVPVLSVSKDGTHVETHHKIITAIPYYTWANRGQSQMQVWLPEKIKDVKINR